MKSLLLAIAIALSTSVKAQESVSLAQVESEFLQSNFSLLASKFEVEAEKALIIQAGLWDNPEIMIDQNIYDRETKKYLNTKQGGQSQIVVTQLFYLAGQKKKAAEVVRMSAASKEEQFFDLLRQLKLDLRSNYFDLHHKKIIMRFYEEGQGLINKSLETVEKNYTSGYVTLVELMRVRNLAFAVENEKKVLGLEIEAHQENLRILSGGRFRDIETTIPEDWDESSQVVGLNQMDLLRAALDSRPDLRAANFARLSDKNLLSLEKARAIPNLRLGADYDRRSNFQDDYMGIVIGFEIPIFDRNQGNIQAASARLKLASAQFENIKLGIERDVRLAYSKAIENDRIFKKFRAGFTNNFDKLSRTINENYIKRYISIIEFADSFESLKNTVSQYNLLKSERLTSMELLNHVTGKEIVKFAVKGNTP